MINLLLTNEHGRKTLHLLALYFFATLGGGRSSQMPSFVLPWVLGGGTREYETVLGEELLRRILLDLAKEELGNIRRDQQVEIMANTSIRLEEQEKGRALTDKEKQKLVESVKLDYDLTMGGSAHYVTHDCNANIEMAQSAYDARNPHKGKSE
jgi:hypothetical protein